MIPCYVIHLGDTFENKKSLQDVGLIPIGFKGVDARKNEHLNYPDNINSMCKVFCPISTIGCGLAHILLAKKLYNENIDIALILEDDAYPKFKKFDLHEILSTIPSDWELIRLHCDIYCDSSNKIKQPNGSAAAYIINRKGIQKQKDLKVLYHVDFQINYVSDIKVYKTNTNLFYTDERTSNIRDSHKVHWISYFLPTPTSGEKSKETIFLYKQIRLPLINKELTTGDLIDIFTILLIIWIFIKYCK